jgi:hypothetical protein
MNRCWFFATLLLYDGLFAWPLQPLQSVAQELIDNHFIRLNVGNPPHTYTFYISLVQDDITISSFQQQTFELQSHSFESGIPPFSSELFLIGPYLLRLPYRYALIEIDRAVRLSTQQTAVGILGLGSGSPFWKYWKNFSLTNDKLVFGDDILDGDELPWLFKGKGSCENPKSGTTSALVIDFSIMELLLPHVLFEEKPSALVVREHKCLAEPRADQCEISTEIELRDQDIPLLTGASYRAIDRSHDGIVHVGRRFFYEIAFFCDWPSEQRLLVDTDSSNSSFNAFYAILISLLAWSWLLLALGKPKDKQLSHTEETFFLYMQLFLFETIAVCWTTNFLVFQWTFAVRALLAELAWFALFYIHASVWISLIGATVLLWKEFHRRTLGGSQNLLSWHLIVLVNGALSILWVCFIQHHHFNSDILFLLTFSTGLCILNGVLFLLGYYTGHTLVSKVLLVPVLLSYTFLVLDNLLLVYDVYFVEAPLMFFFFWYLLIFCILPTLAITSHVLRLHTGYLISSTAVLTATPKADDKHQRAVYNEAQQFYLQTSE